MSVSVSTDWSRWSRWSSGGPASCVGPQDTLFVRDWQHTSYRFAPQGVGGPGQSAWPLSPNPDGTTPSSSRSFGHPWEESICLFGEELLDTASAVITSGGCLERFCRRLTPPMPGKDQWE
ncbi:DUF2716 domain-containing protein [Streptomyces sp. NPDC002666]